jgi:hypothetical protein
MLWKVTIPFESGSKDKDDIYRNIYIYISESLVDEVLRPQLRTLKQQTTHGNLIRVQGCHIYIYIYIYIYIFIYVRARICNGCLHFVESNDSVREGSPDKDATHIYIYASRSLTSF